MPVGDERDVARMLCQHVSKQGVLNSVPDSWLNVVDEGTLWLGETVRQYHDVWTELGQGAVFENFPNQERVIQRRVFGAE